MRAPLFSSLLLVALATPVAADPIKLDGISVECTVEALTTMIVLPASATGTLSYKLCDSCPTVTLSTTATTQYLVGHRAVPLAAVAKLFGTGKPYPALVAFKLDAPVLLRLEVFTSNSASGVSK